MVSITVQFPGDLDQPRDHVVHIRPIGVVGDRPVAVTADFGPAYQFRRQKCPVAHQGMAVQINHEDLSCLRCYIDDWY